VPRSAAAVFGFYKENVLKKYLVILVLLAGFMPGCTTLIPSAQLEELRTYEKEKYILKNDLVLREEIMIKKGTRIKIIMAGTADYAKVYAINDEMDPLKADRCLLLYMFEDDFTDKKYTKDEFEKKFYELVTVYSPPAPAVKPAGNKSK
jgi:type II secretion system-associated lipoprotein